jgi:hypothetical protein
MLKMEEQTCLQTIHLAILNDLGKELGANIFLLKFKQGRILDSLVRFLWLNDFLLGSRWSKSTT